MKLERECKVFEAAPHHKQIKQLIASVWLNCKEDTEVGTICIWGNKWKNTAGNKYFLYFFDRVRCLGAASHLRPLHLHTIDLPLQWEVCLCTWSGCEVWRWQDHRLHKGDFQGLFQLAEKKKLCDRCVPSNRSVPKALWKHSGTISFLLWHWMFKNAVGKKKEVENGSWS